MSSRSSRLCVVAVIVLLVAACGSDASDDATAAAGAGGGAVPSSTSAAPTTTAPAPTTIPLVTVPAGSDTPDAGPSTTAPSNTTPPAGQEPEQGDQQQAGPPDPADPAAPGAPSEPATTLPPTGIPEVDDALGDQPVIEPPEGAGTAMRATITPVDGLAVGDVVTIEAENAPPEQYMAYAQCTEDATDSFDIGVLLTSCAVFGGGGIGFTAPDGTVNVTVTVAADVAGIDCRVETCLVGLIVFPGTDGLRVYEPITLAG